MSRFISWLVVGTVAAFLVVATVAFPPATIVWLAFGVSIGTLAVSAGMAYAHRRHLPTLLAGLAIAAVSAWTVVASLVFAPAIVQSLAFASALALSGLAIVGITTHEVSLERVVAHSNEDSRDRDPRLAAAA